MKSRGGKDMQTKPCLENCVSYSVEIKYSEVKPASQATALKLRGQRGGNKRKENKAKSAELCAGTEEIQ